MNRGRPVNWSPPISLFLAVTHGVNRSDVKGTNILETVPVQQVYKRLSRHELIANQRLKVLDTAEYAGGYRSALLGCSREREVRYDKVTAGLQRTKYPLCNLLNVPALMHGYVNEHGIVLLNGTNVLQGAFHNSVMRSLTFPRE
jgi:hypothetical protein